MGGKNVCGILMDFGRADLRELNYADLVLLTFLKTHHTVKTFKIKTKKYIEY